MSDEAFGDTLTLEGDFLETEFPRILSQVYRKAPCQVLPNPLWKTLAALKQAPFDGEMTVGTGGMEVLSVWSDEVLSVFWTKDRKMPVSQERLGEVKVALLHADYVTDEVRAGFPHAEAYFRLLYHGKPPRSLGMPRGFAFAPVTLPAEAFAVADLIGRCYDDLKPSAATVESWMAHPTFSPVLWVWIVDTSTGERVALGIAELDVDAREGALEWVQVLPDYRGRGLGTALVQQLLRRMPKRASFVTVSGRVDNATQPEALYRRCGFEGQDVWWVLRR